MAQARSSKLTKARRLRRALFASRLRRCCVFGQHADAAATTRQWLASLQRDKLRARVRDRSPGQSRYLVQGWTRLRPGECRTAISSPLARGTHYLYARTSSAHRGGRRQWAGDAILCVDPTSSFTIENPPQCATGLGRAPLPPRADQQARQLADVLLGSPAVHAHARAPARRAALVGRRRLRACREGRRGADPRALRKPSRNSAPPRGLAPNASEDQLIDALETAARRRAGQVGLTLCNRTNARIWTAVGRRRGEGWESRGWWPLNAEFGCVRTIDEVLMQERYYVYASMETSEGPRFLRGGEPFCTSPSRFAILGRDDCEEPLLSNRTRSRRSTPRGREGLVVEFEERDFLEVGVQSASVDAMARDLEASPAREAPRRGLAPHSAPAQDRGRTIDAAAHEQSATGCSISTTRSIPAPALYDDRRAHDRLHRAHARVDRERALELRERYFHQYGATVVGLTRHHGIDAADFSATSTRRSFRAQPDRELARADRASFRGGKSSSPMAAAATPSARSKALGLADLFDDTCSISATPSYAPKPQRLAYERLLRAFDIDPTRAMLVEDTLRNLEPAHEMGFATALVGAVHPEPRPAYVAPCTRTTYTRCCAAGLALKSARTGLRASPRPEPPSQSRIAPVM
jgi:uncharacterized membrane protein